MIRAHIKHSQIGELADIRVYAAFQAIVESDEFVEAWTHVTNTCRYATRESVVGEDDDRCRRSAKIQRDSIHESIIIHENGVQIFVEELAGQSTFEFIEAQV